MEKRAVIEDGRTPPEEKPAGDKQAAPIDLADHVTKRAAEAAQDELRMRSFNEAIALDHVVPFQLITPPESA